MSNNKDVFDMECMLLEYASGSCTEAREILVSSYMSFCRKTTRKVHHFESVGGILMDNMCNPVAMKTNSLDNVLDIIDGGKHKAQSQTAEKCANNIPEIIIQKLNRKGRDLRWRRIYRGIRYCSIPMDCKKEIALLLKIAPGAKTPHHEHKGLEITLILDGAFHDDNRKYTAGEIVVSDANTHHEPIADEELGCVCLMVTTEPVHFTRGLSRLLNIAQRLN